MKVKSFFVSLMILVSQQAYSYTIECLSSDNLQVSQIGFESLYIISSEFQGSKLTVNGKTTELGAAMPYALKASEKAHKNALSLTVVEPFQFGPLMKFNAGSQLTWIYDKKEEMKYRNTTVILRDFQKRVKLELACQMKI